LFHQRNNLNFQHIDFKEIKKNAEKVLDSSFTLDRSLAKVNKYKSSATMTPHFKIRTSRSVVRATSVNKRNRNNFSAFLKMKLFSLLKRKGCLKLFSRFSSLST